MIPDYQSLMLPILKLANDRNEHSIHDIITILAKDYNLTEEELNQFVPSGQQRIFANRVSWAKSYLKMANLIELTKRSHFKITHKGIDILTQGVNSLNLKSLIQFPETKSIYTQNKPTNTLKEETTLETPEEQIESGYQKIKTSLEQEILSKLKSTHPSFLQNPISLTPSYRN